MAFYDKWLGRMLEGLGYVKQSETVPLSVAFSGETPLGGGRVQDWGSWTQRQQERLAIQTSWVYSDIQLIARECAHVPLAVYEQSGEELEAIEAHPFELLMRRPHKYFSKGFLVQYTVTWLLLRGEAYMWQVADNAGGLDSLVPIPASRMRPIPDEENYISGFAYRPGHRANEVEIPPRQVVWFRFPNPFDYHRALSPLAAMRQAIGTDREMVRWNADTYEKGTPLRQIIGLPAELNREVFDKAKRDLVRQLEEKGKRYVVARSGQIDAKDVGVPQKEMEFLAGREFTREEIDRVFGVPAGYWAKEATRANSEAAKASLISNAVWPMLTLLHDELTTQVIQRHYGANLIARFEDIRPENRRLELKEREQSENTQTLNEARAARGDGNYEGPMAEQIAELPVPLATNPQFVMAVTGLAPMGMMSATGRALSKAVVDDLQKWKRVALRRIEDDNDPGEYDFVSDYIPQPMIEDVKAALGGVKDEATVEKIFERHLHGNGKGGMAAQSAPFRGEASWGDYP